MKKVSIIIPFYNSQQYLKRCIDSVIKQTYANLEIILVDNNSTDTSLDICMEYKNDKRIKILREFSPGVSNARNLGLDEAAGDYIAFVDSDDYVQEDFIEQLIKGFNIEDCDISIMPVYKKNKNEIFLDSNQCIETLLKNNNIAGFVWNKLFKRDILKKHKIYFNIDVHMCEDLLFCIQYIKNIKKAVIICENLYNYEKNENSVTKSQFTKKRFSVVQAYNLILKELESCEDKEIYDLAHNNLIKHEIWLWSKLLFNKEEKDKKKYNKILKSDIKKSNFYKFIHFEVQLKYKILFMLIRCL